MLARNIVGQVHSRDEISRQIEDEMNNSAANSGVVHFNLKKKKAT